LPIYNQPMIYYPIKKLVEMGVDSILLISGKGHAGHFLELLGGGGEFGVNLSYEVQEEAGGIAQALSLAEDFVGGEKFVVILGDNIFEDSLADHVRGFMESDAKAHIFLKEVACPEHYGVARLENDEIVEILEKPSLPPSKNAVTGCYLYSPDVFDVIRGLKPSARGELEISCVNDHYVKNGLMSHSILEGFWGDCGESIDGLMDVARHIQKNWRSQEKGSLDMKSSSIPQYQM